MFLTMAIINIDIESSQSTKQKSKREEKKKPLQKSIYTSQKQYFVLTKQIRKFVHRASLIVFIINPPIT